MQDEAAPLAGIPVELSDSGIVALAFGQRDSRLAGFSRIRHLALLPTDALELDLSDPEQRRLGDYELIELIGEGGMGIVYRARQGSLDREVAIKLLAAGPWASDEFIERFKREAQNAARMQHPNIVAIHEVGSVEELHYFSMHLVRGHSLAAAIRDEGRFEPRRAAHLLRTVAEAVDYAHRLDVLHMDLKPANVLLDADGVPHVADFGLARRLEQGMSADNEEISGTPAYMAPEQAELRAHGISAATDLWALGAILYELVAGQPPFQAATAGDTLRLLRDGQVRSPRRFAPGLPRDLEAIVLKCLARDPAQRYASARDLADDLGRFVDNRPVRARPLNAPQRIARWARRQPYVAALAALFALSLLAGIVGITVQWRIARSNADFAQKTLWKSRTDTAQRQIEQGDAYPALANAVANLREMEAHGDRGDAALERLRIGTVLANAPQLVDVVPLGGHYIDAPQFAPDARTLAVVTNARVVHLLDVASGRELWKVDTRDVSFGTVDHNKYFGELRFSADGQRLVAYIYCFYSSGAAYSTMRPHYVDSVLIDVAAGKVVEPPKAFADFLATSYSDDGRYALLFDKHGNIQRWRTQPWAPAGDKIGFKGNFDAADFNGPLLGDALLAQGGDAMVLVGGANMAFRAFDAEHFRPLHALTLDSAHGRATAWRLSADGRQLAIGTATGQVVLWDIASGEATWLRAQLTGWIAALRYSTDDSRLLALSNEPGELDVFDTRSLALVAAPLKLSTNDSRNTDSLDAVFGADADTLLTRHWAAKATLWRLPAAGFPLQAPVAATPAMVALGTNFALAQDARSRLMASSDNDQIKLWRLRPSPLTERVAAPMASDALRFDGRHLVAADGRRVMVFDAATGLSEGTTIVLSEAPTFAGLDGGGTRLVAIAGRQLSCWNWHDGRPCWPAIELPNSALRVSLAARAPVLVVSTGSNEPGARAERPRRAQQKTSVTTTAINDNSDFFEHLRLIDLATGRQRGNAIDLRGPLGTLRLSDDGHRLLAAQDIQTENEESKYLYVIDADDAAILHRLEHVGARYQQVVADAHFANDGSIWDDSGCRWDLVRSTNDAFLWHWSADGRLLSRTARDDIRPMLMLPGARGILDIASAQLLPAQGEPIDLNAPANSERTATAAASADGRLLALGTVSGVALIDLKRNERLLPDFKLPLPYHETVQQLAFAPDGSRLVGRTTSGRWLVWPLVADTRPVADIEQDIRLRDFTPRDAAPPALPDAQRRQLRAADAGPKAPTNAGTIVNANVAAPQPDARYAVLDLDPIANVEPREPMNHATRLPPQPQSFPSLPRDLQRYDGVDFLLGRAVQLSGTPQNRLDAEFPATSPPLALGARRVVAVDALVMQYIGLALPSEVGAVHLVYADGGERKLAITNPRQVLAQWMDTTDDPGPRRIGWLGNFAGQTLVASNQVNAEETLSRSYIVRLVNPEPSRAVTAISLSAPPTASPGLLFLALTLEPGDAAHHDETAAGPALAHPSNRGTAP